LPKSQNVLFGTITYNYQITSHLMCHNLCYTKINWTQHCIIIITDGQRQAQWLKSATYYNSSATDFSRCFNPQQWLMTCTSQSFTGHSYWTTNQLLQATIAMECSYQNTGFLEKNKRSKSIIIKLI